MAVPTMNSGEYVFSCLGRPREEAEIDMISVILQTTHATKSMLTIAVIRDRVHGRPERKAHLFRRF